MKMLIPSIRIFITWTLIGSLYSFSAMAREREGFCNHDHVAIPEIESYSAPLTDIRTDEEKVSFPFVSDRDGMEENSGDFFHETEKSKHDYKIGLKLLFLSATNDELVETSNSLVRITLDAFGIPYDRVVLTDKGVKKSDNGLSLFDSEGNPKYYGVIYSTNELAYQTIDGRFESALSLEEKKIMQDYFEQYNVRKVSLFSFPNPTMGVRFLSDRNSTANNVIETTPIADSYDPSLNKNLKFEISQHWHYVAEAIEGDTKARPFLKYQDGTLAAVETIKPGGQEELHFFFAQSQFTKISLVLSGAIINWLTKGVYQGKRRVYLKAQIDDLFLETDLWNPYIGMQIVDGSYIYRTTPEDLNFFAEYQKSYLRPVTGDPQFKIEPAYNGQGIWKNGGYHRDGLFHEVIRLKDEFNWLSHTFTHPTLDYLPFEVVDWEMRANVLTAQDLFGSLDYPTFSKNSMVTPRISGLFNPNSLRAIDQNGVHNVTGDNTRPELVESLFMGHYTTKEKHGYPGLYIIPRHSTVVYYNVATPVELTSEYNFIYRKHFGRESHFEEIIDREVDRVSRYLLNYEPSPYMFHQANLMTFPYKGGRQTLLGIWLEGIIKELRRYHQLPILSLKMDDLIKEMKERNVLVECRPEAKLLVKDGQYKRILVSNPKNCKVPFTTVGHSVLHEKIYPYGGDRTFYVESNKEVILK